MASDQALTELSTPKTQADRRAEARRRLLVAARSVFEETDFLSVRVSQITERAGVSYGLFYHYFDSKEAVFREVAAIAYRTLMESGNEVEDQPPNVIRAWTIEQGVREWFEQYRLDSALVRSIEAVARYDPEVDAMRSAINRSRQLYFASIIERLQSVGSADAELDPLVTAVAIADMCWRFADSWLVRGDVECDFDRGVEQISRIVRNALRCDR